MFIGDFLWGFSYSLEKTYLMIKSMKKVAEYIYFFLVRNFRGAKKIYTHLEVLFYSKMLGGKSSGPKLMTKDQCCRILLFL